MFVWKGKGATPGEKKSAMKNAQVNIAPHEYSCLDSIGPASPPWHSTALFWAERDMLVCGGGGYC